MHMVAHTSVLRMSQVYKLHVYSTVCPCIISQEIVLEVHTPNMTNLQFPAPCSEVQEECKRCSKDRTTLLVLVQVNLLSWRLTKHMRVCRCVWYKGSIIVFKLSWFNMYRTFPKSAFNNVIHFLYNYNKHPHRPNVLLNILLEEHTFLETLFFDKYYCININRNN